MTNQRNQNILQKHADFRGLPYPRHAGKERHDASDVVKQGHGMSFGGDRQ